MAESGKRYERFYFNLFGDVILGNRMTRTHEERSRAWPRAPGREERSPEAGAGWSAFMAEARRLFSLGDAITDAAWQFSPVKFPVEPDMQFGGFL